MSVTTEIKGVVKEIRDQEQISQTLTKRAIIVETEDEVNGKTFTNTYKVDFVNAKTALVNSLMEGQDVIIKCNLRGRENNGKHFLNLDQNEHIQIRGHFSLNLRIVLYNL